MNLIENDEDELQFMESPFSLSRMHWDHEPKDYVSRIASTFGKNVRLEHEADRVGRRTYG